MITFGKNLFKAGFAAGQNFGADKTPRLAAALSFYALLSMAPLLIFTVSAFLPIIADPIARPPMNTVSTVLTARIVDPNASVSSLVQTTW